MLSHTRDDEVRRTHIDGERVCPLELCPRLELEASIAPTKDLEELLADVIALGSEVSGKAAVELRAVPGGNAGPVVAGLFPGHIGAALHAVGAADLRPERATAPVVAHGISRAGTQEERRGKRKAGGAAGIEQSEMSENGHGRLCWVVLPWGTVESGDSLISAP